MVGIGELRYIFLALPLSVGLPLVAYIWLHQTSLHIEKRSPLLLIFFIICDCIFLPVLQSLWRNQPDDSTAFCATTFSLANIANFLGYSAQVFRNVRLVSVLEYAHSLCSKASGELRSHAFLKQIGSSMTATAAPEGADHVATATATAALSEPHVPPQMLMDVSRHGTVLASTSKLVACESPAKLGRIWRIFRAREPSWVAASTLFALPFILIRLAITFSDPEKEAGCATLQPRNRQIFVACENATMAVFYIAVALVIRKYGDAFWIVREIAASACVFVTTAIAFVVLVSLRQEWLEIMQAIQGFCLELIIVACIYNGGRLVRRSPSMRSGSASSIAGSALSGGDDREIILHPLSHPLVPYGEWDSANGPPASSAMDMSGELAPGSFRSTVLPLVVPSAGTSTATATMLLSQSPSSWASMLPLLDSMDEFSCALYLSEPREIFLRFLALEFSAECLLFWTDSVMYEVLPALQTLEFASVVADRYLRPSSPLQVNLPGPDVEAVLHQLAFWQSELQFRADPARLDLFVPLRIHAQMLMRLDSFMRFQHHATLYRKFKAAVARAQASGLVNFRPPANF